MEYPKIENLYASNGAQDSSRRRGPEFGFKAPGAEQIARWLVTEKVDGMNMRVIWRPYPLSEESDPNGELLIYGRSDKAQITGDLAAYMRETFTYERLVETFGLDELDSGPMGDGDSWVLRLPEEVVLFGEGFGPGVQKAGHAYGGAKRFILFDVVVNGHWLTWDNVVDVAQKLGIPHVPVLARGVDLETAKSFVQSSELLPAGSEHIEGIVARTDPYLFDWRGHRIIFKYKVRDLA